MSRIPDCRTDEYYNQKYLDQINTVFIKGYDWAVKQIQNMFNNLDCYPDLKLLLDDKVAIIKDHKVGMVQTCIEDWAEMERDEMITSMIDNMSEDEYKAIKAKVDGGDEK